MSDGSLNAYQEDYLALWCERWGVPANSLTPEDRARIVHLMEGEWYVASRALRAFGQACLDAFIADARRVYGLFRR
jgi:hypothetical protein